MMMTKATATRMIRRIRQNCSRKPDIAIAFSECGLTLGGPGRHLPRPPSVIPLSALV